MAETKQITFTYRELAEMMVRRAGLTEGLWGIVVRFGISAANVGQSPEDILPAAIVPVLEIGLQRAEEPSRLTVDAAELTKSSPAEPRGARAAHGK